MRGLFVTGTGTEVGKTVVAAALAYGARASGDRVAVFKPAVSGLDDHPLTSEVWENAPDLPDHALLRLAAGSSQGDEEVAPYRYGPAVSPHLAAEQSAKPVSPAELERRIRTAPRDGEPLVVVARPGLGTINHTLLTLEAARSRELRVAGVVLNPWPDEPDAIERSNRATVERLGGVAVSVLPRLAAPDPEALAAAGDGLPLEEWFA